MLINNSAAILSASLIFEDLEINAMDLRFEARNNSVVGRNEMPVIVRLER